MEKLYLITMSCIKNYGSALQTYATSELFKKYGVETTVIDYYREDVLDENLLKSWCGRNIVKRIIMKPTINKWRKVFKNFYSNYLLFTSKRYVHDSDFNGFVFDAKYYCTGSDQVWNSAWNKGILLPLYLSFVQNNSIKFSFSSSFGNTELSDDEVRQTKKYISEYNYLSVREDSGLNILKKQYGIDNAYHLLDPTLCLNKEEWIKIAYPVSDKNYILIYNLNNSKEFDNYAKKLSKLTGCKLIRFCTRYDQMIRCGKPLLVPEINAFISYILNAKYVLTDSFHATAFSINLNVEPICIIPPSFGSRLESFLNLVNCSNRIVSDYSDFSIINNRIDFNNVNEVLDKERTKVDYYLRKVFAHKR